MEAFLLTLDVISLVLLCLGVLRVAKGKDQADLGLFAYSELRVRKVRKTFAEESAPHA